MAKRVPNHICKNCGKEWLSRTTEEKEGEETKERCIYCIDEKDAKQST